MYSYDYGKCPNAHRVSQRIITLPLHLELTKEDTKALAEAVTKLGEPLSQMGIVIDATPKK